MIRVIYILFFYSKNNFWFYSVACQLWPSCLQSYYIIYIYFPQLGIVLWNIVCISIAVEI